MSPTFYIVCNKKLHACGLPLLTSHKTKQSSFETDEVNMPQHILKGIDQCQYDVYFQSFASALCLTVQKDVKENNTNFFCSSFHVDLLSSLLKVYPVGLHTLEDCMGNHHIWLLQHWISKIKFLFHQYVYLIIWLFFFFFSKPR